MTDLAVDGDVAPATQNAAFHGLLKFFEIVLEREMGKIEAIRAKKKKYIPTILAPEEVSCVALWRDAATFLGWKWGGRRLDGWVHGCAVRLRLPAGR